MDTVDDEKEHEVFCGCNGGWKRANRKHPDTLCVVGPDGHCVNIGLVNGLPQHTTRVVMMMFPDYDPLIERRRRSVPEDAVIPMDRSMVHKRVCPRCRKTYHVVVNYEHGDPPDAYNGRNNIPRRLGRTSNILDPEMVAEEMAQGIWVDDEDEEIRLEPRPRR